MRIVNRRRDVEAAHSGVTQFNPTTPTEARRRLDVEGRKIAEDLIHMLRHLSDIEERMLPELHHMIKDATDVCPIVNLFKESQRSIRVCDRNESGQSVSVVEAA